jgi:DNA polymerase III alpha subunit
LTFEGSGERVGVPDPTGEHLVVLARSPEGYRRLSRLLAEGHLRHGTKGSPSFSYEEVAAAAGAALARPHWLSQGPAVASPLREWNRAPVSDGWFS